MNKGVPIMAEWRRGCLFSTVPEVPWEDRVLHPQEWCGLGRVDEWLVTADHIPHICQFTADEQICYLVPDPERGPCASRDGWCARMWWKLAMGRVAMRRANFWVAACWATIWSGGGRPKYMPLQVGARTMEITLGYRRPS